MRSVWGGGPESVPTIPDSDQTIPTGATKMSTSVRIAGAKLVRGALPTLGAVAGATVVAFVRTSQRQSPLPNRAEWTFLPAQHANDAVGFGIVQSVFASF